MKILRLALLAWMALSGAQAQAQQAIVAPSPADSATIELYAAPDQSAQPRQIRVADAGLPLPVQARQGGFLQVDIGGQPYWIRSAKVQVRRGSTASCGTLAKAAPRGQTASTPGVSDDACAKAP